MGTTWEGRYSSGVGQSRDSDTLERSNFAVMVRELEKIEEPEDWPYDEQPWMIVRETHWAIGWIEWIAIHQGSAGHLQLADALASSLADYPILDAMHFAEVESADCETVWNDCLDWRERVQYFRDKSYTGSFRELLRAVRGCWYTAGSLLSCPSDILI